MNRVMKWPMDLVLVRHAESAYNILKDAKNGDPEYVRMKRLFNKDLSHPELLPLARLMQARYALACSDRDTPLTANGVEQARSTGRAMRAGAIIPPDVVFVSPYLRTEETFRIVKEEWPALADAKVYYDERIREQDHGLALVYNDWRIYQLMHPEQGALRRLLGPYDYRYLNGENIPDVRQRNLSWITTLIREFAEKRVMAFTHHLTILSSRANFERMSPQQFMELDEKNKPVNCSVTRYVGNPDLGSQGRLELREYNTRYYRRA